MVNREREAHIPVYSRCQKEGVALRSIYILLNTGTYDGEKKNTPVGAGIHKLIKTVVYIIPGTFCLYKEKDNCSSYE